MLTIDRSNQMQMQVEFIYRDFNMRCSIEAWSNALLSSTDTEDDIVDKADWLLDYLLTHYFLPMKVWNFFDEHFHIVAYMDSHAQDYPPGFLNYVKYYMENEFYIDFTKMEYRDNNTGVLDVDQYIRLMQDVDQLIEQNLISEASEKFAELKLQGVFYPRETVMEMLLDDANGLENEAYELAVELYGKSEDAYTLNKLGSIFWKNGNKERAFSCWKASEGNYDSMYRLAMYYYETGDYHEAKETLVKLFENQQTDQSSELMHLVNQRLIEEKLNEINLLDDARSIDECRFEAANLYMQNDDYEEALEQLDAIDVNSDNEIRYHSLRAKVLYVSASFEEALDEFRTWIQLLDQKEVGSEEASLRPQAVFLYGSCLAEMRNDTMAISVLSSILPQLQPYEMLSAYTTCAMAANRLKNYQQALDFSNEAILMQRDYYPALVERMCANFHLTHYQDTINDFDQAVRIYRDAPVPYYYAMKTFMECTQYKDAEELWKAAERNEVMQSDDLDFLSLILQRNHSKDDYEKEEIIKKMKALLKKEMITDPAEIEYEIGFTYYQLSVYTKSLTYINKAIKHDPAEKKYVYLKADILRLQGKYVKAIALYRSVESDYDRTTHYYRNLGLCYDKMDDSEKALEYYLTACKQNENYHEMDYRISKIYLERYQSLSSPADLKEALRYGKMDAENDPCNPSFYNLGLIYLDSYQYKDAIDCFQKALEFEPEDWWTYNIIGYTHSRFNHFEEAIPALEKAWELGQKEKNVNVRPLINLSRCYEILGDYEQAIHELKEAKKYNKNAVEFRTIAELYQDKKEYETALQYYQLDDQNDPDLHFKMADCYYLAGNDEMVVQSFEKAIDLTQNEGKQYHMRYLYAYALATQYFDYDRALEQLDLIDQIAEKTSMGHWNLSRTYCLRARIYFMLGKADLAKKFGEMSIEEMKLIEPVFEDYLNYFPSSTEHYLKLAECYTYCDRKEEAIAIFQRLKNADRCSYCTKKKCYEAYYREGIVYLDPANSDLKKALALYEEASAIYGNDPEVVAMIAWLKEHVK